MSIYILYQYVVFQIQLYKEKMNDKEHYWQKRLDDAKLELEVQIWVTNYICRSLSRDRFMSDNIVIIPHMELSLCNLYSIRLPIVNMSWNRSLSCLLYPEHS